MNSVKVIYKNQTAGICSYSEQEGKYYFQYSPDFLNSGIQLSPLLLPLENRIFEFDSKTYNPQTFYGLPPLLADSLPDDFGNKMLLQWLVRNNISQNEINPLEKLVYIGKRGMGAVEFEPAYERDEYNDNIIISELLDIANEIYFQKENDSIPLNDYKQSLSTLLRIGSSVGGARAKALIAINEKTQEIKAGDILQGDDFEYYIIKFDGLRGGKESEPSGYGILEFIYYQMAVDCKIHISDCKLLNENGRSHFLTKRFDRQNCSKIHIQTLCGMAGVDFRQPNVIGYEDIFRIINLLNMDCSQKEQLYRRMIFNVLAYNHDDHTKNFSFIYNDGIWKLAPAYDLVFAYNENSYWLKNHNININGKNNNITNDDILAVGEKFNIKKKEKILSEITEVINNFTYYADKNNYPKDKMNKIEKKIRSHT